MNASESHQCRWTTPDPLGGEITNLQSLNRYAYALNNPTTLTDPLGLGPCDNLQYGQRMGRCQRASRRMASRSLPTML